MSDGDPFTVFPTSGVARRAAHEGAAWAAEAARRTTVREACIRVDAARVATLGRELGPSLHGSVSGAAERARAVGAGDAREMAAVTPATEEDDGVDVDVDDAAFMAHNRARRVALLLAAAERVPSWGAVASLYDADALPTIVDDTPRGVIVLVLLWEEFVRPCSTLRHAWTELAAARPPGVRFVEMRASCASDHFDVEGLPALAAYRDGDTIGAWVRIQDEVVQGSGREGGGGSLTPYSVATWLIYTGFVAASLLDGAWAGIK